MNESLYISINEGAKIIQEGGVVAFPTETVYGLGADASNPNAVKKIFDLKGRPPSNPLIVHIASLEQIPEIASPTERQLSFIRKLSRLMPGPLSIVLPKKNSIPDITTAGHNSVAIRIPNHADAISFLEQAKSPVAAPSANISNAISPTSPAHVIKSFGPKCPPIVRTEINNGKCDNGIESTVLSLLHDKPIIIRPGTTTAEQISNVLGFDVPYKENADSVKLNSPGQGKTHYSPNTRCILKTEINKEKDLQKLKVGVLSFGPAKERFPGLLFNEYVEISVGTAPEDKHQKNSSIKLIAQRLYDSLFKLDDKKLDLIIVDTCDSTGIGRAIMDRLRRATAKN